MNYTEKEIENIKHHAGIKSWKQGVIVGTIWGLILGSLFMYIFLT